MTQIQKIRLIVFSVAVFSVTGLTRADIYRSVDSSGNTSYSDRETHSSQRITDSVKGGVNFYSPLPASPQPEQQNSHTQAQESSEETLHDLIAEESRVTQPNLSSPDNQLTEGQLTEAECQEIYDLECDKVINWKKYALEKCGNDKRCKDPAYLDRKYRPRPVSEVLDVAHKAGNRKNRRDKVVQNYMTKRYSNLCRDQIENYCETRYRSGNEKTENCIDLLRQSCKVDQNLNEFMAAYNQLTQVEKEKIIKQAKAKAMEEGEHSLNYAQLMQRVFDIYLTQYFIGI